MTTPTIPEFFERKHIFITGATGFMGKVLVEKLLRSCNDLHTIYILVRERRGMTANERWNKITELPCFSRLKTEYPSALSQKVKVVEGDVREPNLGLSEENYNTILENVNVIFHVAASVRFNDTLPEAIKMNTYGTKQIVELSSRIKNLLVLMHVSTAYCNCQLSREIKEELYETKVHWKTAIEAAENVDPVSLEILCKKFTDFSPNTYVFTKALAEQIVNDYRDQVPVVIFRPTIVTSSWKEPVPGWIDNYNGPIGLIIAAGKGVIGATLSDPDALLAYTTVDIVIKAMIVAAWKTGNAKRSTLGTLDIYSSSVTFSRSVSNYGLVELCKKVHEECPLYNPLWSPGFKIVKSTTMYRIRAFFVHYLFALVIDSILRCLQRPPMLMKIHIKIHNAMIALSYFTTRDWVIDDTKFKSLNNDVLPKDKDAFDFSFHDLDPLEFLMQATIGGKQYLMKEDLSNLPEAKKQARRFAIANAVVSWTSKLVFGYFLLTYLIRLF